MVKAKDWLERNTRYKEVSGILVVTTDDYLKNKFGEDTTEKIIKAQHRISLCELSCSPHSSWLRAHPVPCVSAYQAGLGYRGGCGDGDGGGDDTGGGGYHYVGVVMGGDKYSQCRRGYWRQRVHNSPRVDIIVARGEDSVRMLADYEDDLAAGLVCNHDFFIISEPVGDISSTRVRSVMTDGSTEELSSLLGCSATQYILEHKDGLYIRDRRSNTIIQSRTAAVKRPSNKPCNIF